MTRILLYAILWAFIVGNQKLNAQRIKYDDIFPQLEAGRYTEVEEQLRNYMLDKRSEDDGNAHYQMARMLDHFASSMNVVTDSSRLIDLTDSSIYYYRKAKSLIDYKELNRNDKYYQEFKRRDLRSGEFEIKLSDVQLDIDNRISSMQTRGESTFVISQALQSIEKNYKEAQSIFKRLTANLNSLDDLVVSIDDQKISQLNQIIDLMDEIDQNQKSIIEAIIVIDNAGFRLEDNRRQIEDINLGLKDNSKIYRGKLDFWDYKKWANSILETYDQEYGPLLNKMKKLSIHYSELMNKVENNEKLSDSEVSSLNEIFDLDPIKSIDPNSLPYNWLMWTKSLIEFKYLTALSFRGIDSTEVDLLFHQSDTLMKVINGMAEALNRIDQSKEYASQKYGDFISEFGGIDGFINSYETAREWYVESKKSTEYRFNYWKDKVSWGICESDSIYLVGNKTQFIKEGKYAKYTVMDSKKDDKGDLFTFGVINDDSRPAGFLAKFDKSKNCEWVREFKLLQSIPEIYGQHFDVGFIGDSEGDIIFYYYLQQSIGKENFRIINYSLEGEQNWSKELSLSKQPYNITYNQMLRETLVLLYDQDKIATLDGSEKGYYVIDRAGNLR